MQCECVNDTTLRCLAPVHPVGIVRVVLLRCEDEAAVSDDEEDEASFEFVRLEHVYDKIFATTNSFCPVRSAADAAGAAELDRRHLDSER